MRLVRPCFGLRICSREGGKPPYQALALGGRNDDPNAAACDCLNLELARRRVYLLRVLASRELLVSERERRREPSSSSPVEASRESRAVQGKGLRNRHSDHHHMFT